MIIKQQPVDDYILLTVATREPALATRNVPGSISK